MSRAPVTTSIITTLALLVSGPELLAGKEPEGTFLPGYVITIAQDTIRGWILLKDHVYNTRKCAFRSSPDGEIRYFSPRDVSSYCIDGKKYFHSQEIDKDASIAESFEDPNVFLECLVKGKVSLYFFESRYFLQTAENIQELTNSEAQVTKHGKVQAFKQPLYKFTLRKAMGDCLYIDQYLETVSFSKQALSKMLMKYHACTSSNAVSYEASQAAESIRTSFSFTPGIYLSTLKMQYDNPAAIEFAKAGRQAHSKSMCASFYFHFGRPAISSRQEFKIGLSIYAGEYEIQAENAATNLSHALTINSVALEIPLLMKRYILKKKLSLYFQGGVGLNKFIKWSDRRTVRVLTSSNLLTESENDLSPHFVGINLLAGPGLELPLGSRHFIFESFYSFNPSAIRSSTLGRLASVTAITINAGVKF